MFTAIETSPSPTYLSPASNTTAPSTTRSTVVTVDTKAGISMRS